MKNYLRLSKALLDSVDVELLRILHKDARTPMAEIARALKYVSPERI